MEYVAITDEPHIANGIVRTVFWVRGSEYFTVLQVNASVRNNNTEIKCRAAESNVESGPVFLRVQGTKQDCRSVASFKEDVKLKVHK